METREKKNSKIQKEIFREERNQKIKKTVTVTTTILSIFFIILMYGIFVGAKITKVNEYKITSEKIPTSFHGTKVVQISDILYNSLNQKDLKRLTKKINALEADILIFTGNIIQKDVTLGSDDIKILEDFFKNLNATIDKFAVKGEYDDSSFYVIMENSNFKVLANENALLYNRETTPIEIIGFDTTDLKTDVKKEGNYTICIFNNPDAIDELKNNCNLALAGDTLGGELKIPILNIPILDNHKYNKDYYNLGETEFFISNGLGNNSNIRLFNHPSINLYRITRY